MTSPRQAEMEDNFHASVCISGAVLVVTFSLTAVVLNSLQLIVLWKDPTQSLRSSTTVYIASLSVLQMCCALFAGTASTESYIACAQGKEQSPHFGKEFTRISFAFFVRVESFVIVAFATERLGSICFPVFYQGGRYKAKNAFACVVCIILYSLCFSIFDMIAGKFWIRRLDAHLNTIPIVAIIAMAAILYHSLRKLNILQLENNGCDISLRESPEESHTHRLKKQRPFANAFILIAVLFVVSIIPYIVFSLYEVHCSECYKQEWFVTAMRISLAMTFVTKAANPFVYYACVKDFREGFKILFCGKLQPENFFLKHLRRNYNKGAPGTVPVIYL